MTDGWQPTTRNKVAFERAELEAAQVLEDAARRRAFEGVLKGVYYRGKLVGYELKYSDRLLVQLLKAHHLAYKPAARQPGTGKGGDMPAPFIDEETLAKLSEEQVLAIRVVQDGLDSVRIEIEAALESASRRPGTG